MPLSPCGPASESFLAELVAADVEMARGLERIAGITRYSNKSVARVRSGLRQNSKTRLPLDDLQASGSHEATLLCRANVLSIHQCWIPSRMTGRSLAHVRSDLFELSTLWLARDHGHGAGMKRRAQGRAVSRQREAGSSSTLLNCAMDSAGGSRGTVVHFCEMRSGSIRG